MATTTVELHAVRIYTHGAQVVRKISGLMPGQEVSIEGLCGEAYGFHIEGGGVKVATVQDVAIPGDDGTTRELRDLTAALTDFAARSRAVLSRQRVLQAKKKNLTTAAERHAAATPVEGIQGYSKEFQNDFLAVLDITAEQKASLVKEECALEFDLMELVIEEIILRDRIDRVEHPVLRDHFGAPSPYIRRELTIEDFSARAPKFEEAALELHVKGCRQTKVLRITAQENAPSEGIDLELCYAVPKVNWDPVYTLHCNTLQGNTLLEYMADITNFSGEDWTKCQMSLERSSLSLYKAPPECPVTRVEFQPDAAPLRRMMAKSVRGDVCTDSAMPAPNVFAAEVCCFGSAGVSPPENAGIAASFKLTTSIDLYSRPGKQRVCISSQELESCRCFCWVALETGTEGVPFSAARVMHAVNSTGFEMLEAPARIFVDGQFLGTTALKQVRVNKAFSFGIGPSHHVTVVEQRPQQVKQAGSMLANGSKVHTVRYVMKNSGSTPVAVFVVANCPLATDTTAKVTINKPALTIADCEEDDDIAVSKVLDSSPSGAFKNAITNNVVQKVTISPGSVADGIFEYSIAVPQGKEIEVVPV